MSDAFSSIDEAIARIRDGGMVIVVDDEDRENEGDLIMAAEAANPETIAFFVNHTSGVICVPMLGWRLDDLEIPLMVQQNEESHRTAFTVSVDAKEGVTTGISAADRARTIRLLIDEGTGPGDLVRPGHIFPLRYREGGVLRRPGHTEASVDLARLAGMYPSGVLCEIVNSDGTMARLPELIEFSRVHELPLISIADLIAYRRKRESLVKRIVETRMPTPYGDWRAIGYETSLDGPSHHVALVFGDAEGRPDVLVRMHSECLTGDVFRSSRCDCGAQLDLAMAQIAAEGRGVVVYLRGHEGRGIGLIHKLQAYGLQDQGHDTVEANLALGLPADSRDYGIGAMMLADLGLSTVRLLTNNPAKLAGLDGFGLRAERVPLQVRSNPANAFYLETKAEKLGHVFTAGSGDEPTSTGVGDLVKQARVAHEGLAFAPFVAPDSWDDEENSA